MSQEINHSAFDLLKGRWIFSKKDPIWFKILMYVLTMLFFWGLVWIICNGPGFPGALLYSLNKLQHFFSNRLRS
jgi:hypothetical protein